MKIGIITVYDSIINYGSFLQALAMQEVLKEMGHEVYFIRRMEDREILRRFNRLSWANGLPQKEQKYVLIRLMRNLVRYISAHRLNRKRYLSAKQDWTSLNIISKECADRLGIGCYICGSDEIWNLHNRDIDIDFYTCSWLGKSARISYAISIGDTEKEEFNESVKTAIASFSMIMPRDNHSEIILKEFCSNVSRAVCDPTILYGKSCFSKYLNQKQDKGRYMLVYSYVYSKNMKKNLRRYADKNGLKIVSLCISADFADEVLFEPAISFPAYVAGAECMYTSTYHGTIFGLMFSNSLCCYPRFGKVKEIITQCEVSECAVNGDADYEDIEETFSRELDHKKIDKNMERMRKESTILLKDVLKQVEAGSVNTKKWV